MARSRHGTDFMKHWTIPAFLTLIICASCKPQMSSETFKARENAYFAAYCTNDIKGAEQALLEGLKAVESYEKNYTIEGIDFNANQSIFHERLFLIYQANHETNKMASELRQSIEFVNQSRASQHLPPLNLTDGEFAAKLQSLDQGKDIRWKKERLDKAGIP
jgi:hypothetical protein